MTPFLLETVAWPPAFGASDPARQALVVVVLHHLSTQPAVILVDSQRCIVADLAAEVRAWSDSPYKQQALALLGCLHDRHRLVKVHAVVGGSTSCERVNDLIRQVGDTRTAIVPDGCRCARDWCHRCSQGQSVADLAVRKDWWTSGPLPRMDLSTFEQQVWRPWFAHTRTLTLIDRNLGRSAAQHGRVADRWRISLSWIVQCFVRYADRRAFPGTRITVITGTGYAAQTDMSRLRASLAQFQAALNSDLPPQFVRIVLKKEEKPPSEMPHERHLVTDQGIWQIPNGLDLATGSHKPRVAKRFYATPESRSWEEIEREYRHLWTVNLARER